MRARSRVNLWVAFLIIAGATALGVAAMLAVRRFAPVGGFFTDSDRAAGVFGVVGTSFAVLLAFVIFLAFESYSNARSNAEVEAVAVSELFNTAELFPPQPRERLQGDLICYARAVIVDEWRTMREGDQSPRVESWRAALEATIARLELGGAKESAAYEHWFNENAERRAARRERLAEAAPFVPPLLWLVLILGAVLVVAYMCFYADRGEPAAVQALMMGCVAAVAASGLLTIRFLDTPYENRSGSIRPTAMARSLELMEREWQRTRPAARVPCDGDGVAQRT